MSHPPPLSHPPSLSSASALQHAPHSSGSSRTAQIGSDPYIRVKQLGQGSFGRVLLVRDQRDGELYVMKEVDLQQFGAKGRKEAMKEVAFLNQLAHPFIITYKEFFERAPAANAGGSGGGGGGPVPLGKDGRPDPLWADQANKRMLFIVMEYADGGDLDAKIKRQKKLHGGALFPESQVIQWFVQIVLGLKHIHDRRILHRDIKSENIFLMRATESQGESLRIGDFGISKHLNSTMAQALTRIGTPYYLSPEICMNKPYNQKSDIWSLGVVLYELCTLRHPFDATSMESLLKKIVKGQHGPLNSRQYSPELRALVDQLLAKDPKRRPSINEICRIDWLQSHIVRHLPPSVLSSEFSHTLIHDYQPPSMSDLPTLNGGGGGGGQARHTHPPPNAPSNQQAQALALIKKRKAAAAAVAAAAAQAQAYPNYALPPPTKPHAAAAYPPVNGSYPQQQQQQQQAPHPGIRAVAKKAPKHQQQQPRVGSGSEIGSDDDLAHLPSPYAAKHPPPPQHSQRQQQQSHRYDGMDDTDDASSPSSQPNYGQHNAGARLKKNQARVAPPPPLLPPPTQLPPPHNPSSAAALRDAREGLSSPGAQARFLSGAPIDEREHRRFREYEQALMVQRERERELEREKQKERELQKQLAIMKGGGGGGGGAKAGWQQQQQHPQAAYASGPAAHAMSDGTSRRRRAHAPPALGSGPLPSAARHAAAAAAAALPFNPNDLPPAGMHPSQQHRGAAPHRGDRDRNTTHDLLAHQEAGSADYPPIDGAEYTQGGPGATHVRASERARREDELAAIRETYMLEKATRRAVRLAEQEKTRNHILPVGRGAPSPSHSGGAHQLGPAAAAAQQAMMQSHASGSHSHVSSLQAPYAHHLPSPHQSPSHRQQQHPHQTSLPPPARRSGVSASPAVLPASAYRDAAAAAGDSVYEEIYESDSVSPPPPPQQQGGSGAEIEEEDYTASEQDQSYEEDFDESPLPPPRQISPQQQQQQMQKQASYHEKTQPRFSPTNQQQQQQQLHQLHAPPAATASSPASRNYPARSHPHAQSSVAYNVPPPSQLHPLHHPPSHQQQPQQQQRKGIPAAPKHVIGGGGGSGAKKGHPAMQQGVQLVKVGGGGWNKAH